MDVYFSRWSCVSFLLLFCVDVSLFPSVVSGSIEFSLLFKLDEEMVHVIIINFHLEGEANVFFLSLYNPSVAVAAV